MSWFDIIVILVLLAAFIKGLKKGLTMQLAGLVAIIIGAIFAGKAAEIILPYLLDSLNNIEADEIILSYRNSKTPLFLTNRNDIDVIMPTKKID